MRERLSRLDGWAFTHIPGLCLLWARTTQSVVGQQHVPWVPLRMPLAECRVTVITIGGVHLVNQVPFDMGDPHGDPSYRVIAIGTPRSHLAITHNYYDHRDARGAIKMVADDTGEVLGVSMVGVNAGEVIHEAAMALRFHATVDDFIDLIHVYPSMIEALKLVAVSRCKDPARLSCCAE